MTTDQRVAVCVTAIPPRQGMLVAALASIAAQTLPAWEVSIAMDLDHHGAPITRNRAWRNTSAPLVTFLDDDDEYEYNYLELMVRCLVDNDADMVFPHYEVIGGGSDPFPDYYGKPWDPEHPRQTTICCLWRREALEKVDGFPTAPDDFDPIGHRAGEDYLAVCRLNELGGKIVHLPERLFRWRHHQSNTSGRPDRW